MTSVTRMLVSGFAALAFGALGGAGIAHAEVFDDQAYSTCTALAAPGVDMDGVATSCCVENFGVPTPTRFGIGCVSAMANPAPDYRPVIFMPTRQAPPEVQSGDVALEELMKQPPMPGPPLDAPLP
ncbi:MAG: hypothetical protein JHC55_23055 [Mycolicibacterium sp.]|nr:hypothetical protein [Mycolicibacterium sp.]